MGAAYLRHMKNQDRADWLFLKSEELEAKLKAGETVRVGQRQTMTPECVDLFAEENDLTRDEACAQLAAHYVEEWVRWIA